MSKTGQNRLGMYEDVKAILDAALSSGGGSVELATPGAAVHWRHRAYKFRKLFAETTKSSPYDALTFPRLTPGSCVVEIRPLAQPAIFKPADGAIPITSSEADPDDELLRHALDLSKDLDV